MTRPDPDVDPKTVQRFVLARLFVRREELRSKVVTAVAAAIHPPLAKPAAREAAERAIASCETSGQLVATGKRLALSDEAKRGVVGLLGVQSLPPNLSWPHAQQLVALSAIGREPASRKRLGVNDLAALALAQRENVPASIQTLPEVVDYLAWRALGVETTDAFDVYAVQRHLLRRLVRADVRVGKAVWRRMLAMRALDARDHDAKSLMAALVQSRPVANAVANTNDPRPNAQPGLTDFAQAVRAAAELPTVARFHDDRAFIGSIWDHMRGRTPVGDMTLSEFKQRLIAAHRDGLLRITRADLVGAMDRTEVERSEARYQDATFHFVALEAGGER